MLLRNAKAMRRFEVVPAVDLLGDEAVRLEQGDPTRIVARETDPVALARRFAEAGARTIHVVDLEGARSGITRPERVAGVARAVRPVAVQASGGVRSPADAVGLVRAGAARVVVGTAAHETPTALAAYVRGLGPRLVVAIDVLAGKVRTAGWTAAAGEDVEDAVRRCLAAGAPRLLCTAIDRDGTLTGPDLELLERIVALAGDRPVLAAGGVRSESDLQAVCGLGCEGAVVGRALLTGDVPLSVLAGT